MQDWIEIGGVSNDALGVILMMCACPPMPTLQREYTNIPGRLGALVSDYAAPEKESVYAEFAITGDTLADCWATYNQQNTARWLHGLGLPKAMRQWTAPSAEYNEVGTGNTIIRFSEYPGRYYIGRISAIEVIEEVDKWIRLKAVFDINPPSGLRALSKQPDYIPALTSPPPEQITAAVETCSGTFTDNGWLPEIDFQGANAAALYFVITGTWQRLQIGGGTGLGLEWERTTPTTVYVDCDAQQIYYTEDDQRISLSSAAIGDYPMLREPGAIAIGGEDINITVRLLVVERG